MSKYPYDGPSITEYMRLIAMETAYDPKTIHHLGICGVSDGWKCLEVGAGAGSIALWLSKQVGNAGKVTATDINTEFIARFQEQNLEILRHDITADDLPENQFDLVHVRFLLDFLPKRDLALDRMINALKVGGWIVIEEFDSLTSVPDSSVGDSKVAVFMKIQDAMRKLWIQNGFDADYGRKLLGKMTLRGLEDVRAEGYVFMRRGGTDDAKPWRLSVEQLREKFIQAGLVTEEEIDHHQRLLEDPEFSYFSPLRVIAWGKKSKETLLTDLV